MSWKRYLLPGLVVCVGVCASLAVFALLWMWQARHIEQQFEYEAKDRALVVAEGIHDDLRILNSIAALYAASERVDRHEFARFVEPLFKLHQGIQTLAWVPRVDDSQRDAVELSVRQEGYPDFRFTDRNSRGNLVPAATRAEYFPVVFVEPNADEKFISGLDLASDPASREALHRAIDVGQAIATKRITVGSGSTAEFRFSAFLPVYKKGASLESAAQRRKQVEGVILGHFSVARVVLTGLRKLHPKEIDFLVRDDLATEGRQFAAFTCGADPAGT